MRRALTTPVPFLVLMALVTSLQPGMAQSYEDLAGGWLVQSWTSADGALNDSPQQGLFLFTATGQYSMMYVNTAEPRPDISEGGPDAELLDAWQSFTANSGRYRLSGDQLTYEAYVAKWPNYMNRWDVQSAGNATTVTMSMEGESLVLQWEDRRKVMLRRAPGTPGS